MEERQKIIETLRLGLLNDENICALWLEGADGLGRADNFSDLEVWIDAADGYERDALDKCGALLSQIGRINYADNDSYDPKLFNRVFHIEGTSEFLQIDICVQSHSRGSLGCTFYADDIAEFPLVLFDKAEVVRILPPEPISVANIKPVFDKCVAKFNRRQRLLKYIRRGKYMESLHYFEEYIRFPIVCMMRLIYTPRHYEYHYMHLSDHLPRQVVKEMEQLYKTECVDDIEFLLEKANTIYYEAYNALKGLLEPAEEARHDLDELEIKIEI
jgi:hypothetical protein